MCSKQWSALVTILCVTFVTIHLASAGGGGHGHGHGHGNGGGQTQNQCSQANTFFNQWWPQSPLGVGAIFQLVCRQLGAVQAWSSLQGVLGVPVTGVLDQTTFQALLNNANHALLAQQLLAAAGNVSSG